MSDRAEIEEHYRRRGLSGERLWSAMQRHRGVIRALDPLAASELLAPVVVTERADSRELGPLEAKVQADFAGVLSAAARAWGLSPSALRWKIESERAKVSLRAVRTAARL
jgi:hypothetical protein